MPCPQKDEADIVTLQREVARRLGDLIDQDPAQTAIAMVQEIVRMQAHAYPARLTREAQQNIRKRHTQATTAQMADRAMREEGIRQVFALALRMVQFALAYYPQPDTEANTKAPSPHALDELVERLSGALAHAQAQGVAPLEALSATVATAILGCQAQKISPAQVTPKVFEGLALAWAAPKAAPGVESPLLRRVRERVARQRKKADFSPW